MTQKPLTLTDILEEFENRYVQRFTNTDDVVITIINEEELEDLKQFLTTSLRQAFEAVSIKRTAGSGDFYEGFECAKKELETNITNFFNKKI